MIENKIVSSDFIGAWYGCQAQGIRVWQNYQPRASRHGMAARHLALGLGMTVTP